MHLVPLAYYRWTRVNVALIRYLLVEDAEVLSVQMTTHKLDEVSGTSSEKMIEDYKALYRLPVLKLLLYF